MLLFFGSQIGVWERKIRDEDGSGNNGANFRGIFSSPWLHPPGPPLPDHLEGSVIPLHEKMERVRRGIVACEDESPPCHAQAIEAVDIVALGHLAIGV